MAKKPDKKAVAPDKLFVFGLDDNGKPRGARFAECEDKVVNVALDMMLACVHPASAEATDLGMKLPQGRVYASGKAFVPNIRRDLYDKLIEVLKKPDDGSVILRLEKPPGTQVADEAEKVSSVACVSPITSGLPRNWDGVGVGHMVLVHESPADGWWEAVVVAREEEILTLRFRDYPKLPTMVRHINTVALVNPGPN